MAQNEAQQDGQFREGKRSASPARRPIYKDFILLQLFALVLVADQLTKWLIRVFLEFRESVPDDGFFRLTHTYNTGSAFGLFRDQNLPLILVSIVGITILMLIYRSQGQPGNLLRLSLGLQFGGAAGNLLDRIRLGHVTDFVDVGSWPIFNVADASIVLGLGMLAWMFLITDGSKPAAGPANTASANKASNQAASEATGSSAAMGIPIGRGGSHTGIPEGLDISLLPGDDEDPGADFNTPGGAPKADDSAGEE
jgi:signal peptidase II